MPYLSIITIAIGAYIMWKADNDDIMWRLPVGLLVVCGGIMLWGLPHGMHDIALKEQECEIMEDGRRWCLSPEE